MNILFLIIVILAKTTHLRYMNIIKNCNIMKLSILSATQTQSISVIIIFNYSSRFIIKHTTPQ